MKAGYRKILSRAENKKQGIRKFLEKIRKDPPKDLDRVTHVLHEEAFESVSCLECANCCSTTGPLLKNRDIDRLAEHFGMRPSRFADQYLRTDEDGDYVFKSMPCPFLGTDNFCSVYENRPAACREYPHTDQREIRKILAITYKNAFICPAVVLVIEGLRDKYD